MQIKNIEGLTVDELNNEVNNGGKFVFFQYTMSFLIITFKRPSAIYFIRANEKAASKGVQYTLLSAVLGWWGIPWGPIYTIQSIINNSKGGKDVTLEVMKSLSVNTSPQTTSKILAQ